MSVSPGNFPKRDHLRAFHASTKSPMEIMAYPVSVLSYLPFFFPSGFSPLDMPISLLLVSDLSRPDPSGARWAKRGSKIKGEEIFACPVSYIRCCSEHHEMDTKLYVSLSMFGNGS